MKEELTAEERIALKKAQWEKAMAGDTKMLIFLGKQYLGQKDIPDMDLNMPFKGVEFVIPKDAD